MAKRLLIKQRKKANNVDPDEKARMDPFIWVYTVCEKKNVFTGMWRSKGENPSYFWFLLSKNIISKWNSPAPSLLYNAIVGPKIIYYERKYW